MPSDVVKAEGRQEPGAVDRLSRTTLREKVNPLLYLRQAGGTSVGGRQLMQVGSKGGGRRRWSVR